MASQAINAHHYLQWPATQIAPQPLLTMAGHLTQEFSDSCSRLVQGCTADALQEGLLAPCLESQSGVTTMLYNMYHCTLHRL